MQEWTGLYYCGRCDGVFKAGDGRLTPVDEMAALLRRSKDGE